jgi:predicted Zn-dependent peptidase
MSFWNKKRVTGLFMAAALLATAANVGAAVQKHTFITSKGLKVKLLLDPTMDFIHAELLIFHKGKYNNPAVPALTLMNLFDKNVNKSGSGLMNALKRMGNDFEVEQTPDYLVFKINFLPDRLQQFARFLKSLYSYKPLLNIKINPDSYTFRKREHDTREKFNNSTANYWRYFFKKENWKRDIAYQIAYNKLFPGSSLGNTLITAEALKQASLSRVRTFYQRAFRLPNSLLIIKGSVSPHLVRAYINGEFASFSKQIPEVSVEEEKLRIHHEREIVVFNFNSQEPPVMFWFNAIQPLDNERHIHLLVLNNILFGFPTGRIYRSARGADLNNLDIQSEITNQENVSVICNTIELRCRDIEKFIRLTDRERKKMTVKRVERKEYLNTLSYFYGKIKVDTQHFDSDINHEILTSFYPFKKGDFWTPAAKARFANFTLDGLNEHIEESKNGGNSPEGVIVIVGNYDLIKRCLETIKPVVFNY